MAIFENYESTNKRYMSKSTYVTKQTQDSDISFDDIVNRIESQSHSYSNRNSAGEGGKESSIFIEKIDKDIFYYIPLFNYFDREATWIKVDGSLPIKISKAYSYYLHEVFTKDEINKKLKNGYIENFIISKETVNKVDLSISQCNGAIYILNEILYSKKIYFVICFEVYGVKKWVKIPLEGALSTRGKDTLRTDEHGNDFSGNQYIRNERYETYEINI